MERIQVWPFRLGLTVAVRAVPVVSCNSKQSTVDIEAVGYIGSTRKKDINIYIPTISLMFTI